MPHCGSIMSPDAAFASLVALQVKHAIADYFLQTPYMVLNKGTYGHPGGLLHAGLHASLTILLLLAFGIGGTALMIGGLEFALHYHIDWSKEKLSKRLTSGPDNASFWMLHGTDQAAHQMTYVAMVWWLVGTDVIP